MQFFKLENWFETAEKKIKYFEGKKMKNKEILELHLNKEYTGKKKGQENSIKYLWKD